jgi:DNA invertase Pin-like site-specific DNA recombinase
MLGAFAQFERALIRERQREGIAIAKREGRFKGRPPKLTDAQVTALKARAAAGEARTNLAMAFGLSRATVYAVLAKQTTRDEGVISSGE